MRSLPTNITRVCRYVARPAAIVAALLLVSSATTAMAQFPFLHYYPLSNNYGGFGRKYVATEYGLVPYDQYQVWDRTRLKLGVQGYAVRSGLKITRVFPATIADRAGIERGDVVMSVNGVRPQNYADLNRGLRRRIGTARLLIMDCRTGRTFVEVVHY